MNPHFFNGVEKALATERRDAYRQDGVPPAVALARYLWNMALCETLYSPLQIMEVALRNAIHTALSEREGLPAWYETICGLMPWQQQQVADAKAKLKEHGKTETPGRVVAEMHFGFWTGFFNNYHARTGIGYALAHKVFANAPSRQQNMKDLDSRLNGVRELRNRVFHHERIIHWKDLDTQHADLLLLVGWISPDLRDLASALDRFTAVRRAGHAPWLHKLGHHWPDPATATTPENSARIAEVFGPFDATDGADTPFGQRWGGDVFALKDDHIDTLLNGQTLALDVQSEYIAFLKHEAQPSRDSDADPSPATPEAQNGASRHDE